MATVPSATGNTLDSADHAAPTHSASLSVMEVVRAFGSLKLTVMLFALSLVIVLVGTLAQDEMNMLDVKQRYFLSWIAPLHLDDFVPQSFYPHEQPLPLVIPFPGGALIGVMLMINLVAAKIVSFKVHASGGRLVTGVGFLAMGLALSAVIISYGNSTDGLQGEPGISYDTLWWMTVAATASLGLCTAYASSRTSDSTIRVIGYAIAISLLSIVFYCVFSGFRVGDPGLRIVWQLAKGLGVGLVLMIGCLLLFGKQGGNVLLHLGVGLLMFGQFIFGDHQLEQRLTLVEGESTNQLINWDKIEMTFVQTQNDQQEVIGIPVWRLKQANQNIDRSGGDSVDTSKLIRHDALPFDVGVLQYYENSRLADVSRENLATAGAGLANMALPRPKAGGAESEINLASAYVELFDKQSGDSKGVHLISQFLSERKMLLPDQPVRDVYDTVAAGDKKYQVGLRFHREVKPYWVKLNDVRRTNYSGTETPRDYSSYIRIIHPAENRDFTERVWMNNPLRYSGETFYQSSYAALPGGKEQTTIQVVRNAGWLIPYVACSITALGMLVHFLGTLTRFMARRRREAQREIADWAERQQSESNQQRPSRLPVVLVTACFALLAFVKLVPWSAVKNTLRPSERVQAFDFYAAGKIPVQFGGRVMPLDSYARQALKSICNKESLPLDEAPIELRSRVQGKKLSAMQWLMESAVDQPELRDLRMFRIDADEVRNELELGRRESKLYSLREILRHRERVEQIVSRARDKDTKALSFKERKTIELNRRTQNFVIASTTFQLPMPRQISLEELRRFEPEADESRRQLWMIIDLQRRMESLSDAPAPAMVVPTQASIDQSENHPEWGKFAPEFFNHFRKVAVRGGDADEAPLGVDSFSVMMKAYSDSDPAAFNQAVDEHLAAANQRVIPGYTPSIVGLERWMKATSPTTVALVIYVMTFVLGLFYFLINAARLRESVWTILMIAFVVHTIAILCRIGITGRAPVINLYSAAVFIGWVGVFFGLCIERIFKYGIGNVLSSAVGAMTLLVANGLSTGDTMPVLQAVLDTQFWLATHVISVTMGYSAMFLAGTLGIGYLVASWTRCDEKWLRNLYRCCYGAACFGVLFSFVGTVLGGLWADDSWGRFWGWDPKENGAMLIVIWVALMLHARWDGMVKGRGFSRLAIGGNVVTAWSFFGTNELGIGLHSYGFTSGVLFYLSLFVGSQLLIIVVDGLVGYFASRATVEAA